MALGTSVGSLLCKLCLLTDFLRFCMHSFFVFFVQTGKKRRPLPETLTSYEI